MHDDGLFLLNIVSTLETVFFLGLIWFEEN